jgi:alpha-amylase/alpha-mannosidase (GH57 family)
MMQEHENTAISLNLNANLIEMLQDLNLGDTLEIIKNLRINGKIQILSTAKYHPILPLIPEKEIRRQINLNEEKNIEQFENWKREGFFPPELSISARITHLIRQLGYKWVLLSGIACPLDWPYNKIYCSVDGLKLFFRDDILSNKISFNNTTANQFINQLKNLFNDKKNNNKDKYVIIAMDSETFGHHHKNYERTFLSKALELINDEEDLQMTYVSELEKYFPISNENVVPRDSSWSTTEEDLKNHIPYPLWSYPDNKIHQIYWKMLDSLNHLITLISNLEYSESSKAQEYYATARWFFDRAVCSDTTWWANPDRDIWSPNLIYKGIELIIRTALNAQLALDFTDNADLGESYFNLISSYHNHILTELNTFSKSISKSKKKEIKRN